MKQRLSGIDNNKRRHRNAKAQGVYDAIEHAFERLSARRRRRVLTYEEAKARLLQSLSDQGKLNHERKPHVP
jgi:hypothetical protein